MKKLIFLMALIPAIAMAAPFIVCDPHPDAVKFRMRLSTDNGATWGEWAEGNPVDGAAKFDVAGLPKGVYKGEMQAGAYVSLTDSTTNVVSTVWAWSDSAPFVLDKKTPEKPKTIKVIP